MMTVLIVENNKPTARYMRQLLVDHKYDVLGMVASGEEALSFISDDYMPDLIIMDIELDGELTGIETVSKIKEEHEVAVIFLSQIQDEEVWVKAKLTKPQAQLTKPFDDHIFLGAIEIAFKDIGIQLPASDDEANHRPPALSDRMFVRTKQPDGSESLELLLFKEILRIEADLKHSKIFTTRIEKDKRVTLKEPRSITQLIGRLPEDDFMQVHRSHVVNLTHVQSFHNDRLILTYPPSVSVSSTYKRALLDKLK